VDDFTTCWNRVLLRVPAAGPDLSQDLIRDAFNQLAERREWTWLMKTNSFYSPIYVTGGTVSAIDNSAVVTGVGTTFIQDMVTKQIRIGAIGGSSYPTYTITQVVSPNMLVLDRPWVGPSLSTQAYVVFQCYFIVPTDFQYFYSVVNPSGNYRLNHDATQAELDSYDPQRSQSGIAYAMAYYDTTQNHQGIIGPALRIQGSGSTPVTTTAVGYSYPEDSIYSITITQGGNSGTAQFSWLQDTGTTSGTGVITSLNPIDLSNGVQVFFPAGVYVAGDVFVISCQADATSGLPRFEMWPRPINSPYVYPYQYACKLPALSDENPVLPNFVARRGDVLVEMALTNLALWPGTADSPNPYRDVNVANIHRATAERLIYELEKKDDDTGIKNLTYQGLPYMGPWRDGSWLQRHAFYPDY